MANLDERLMGNTLKPEEEDEAARELKNSQQGGDEEADTGGEPRSLRQRVQSARQALDLKQRAKDKLAEKVTAPARLATSRVLMLAWLALIPSFGLSLLYINLHVFLRLVFGEKLFCKLGEEWLPKQIAGTSGGAGKMANRSVGLIEGLALAILDAVAAFVLFGGVVILVWLYDNMLVKIYNQAAMLIDWIIK